MRKPEICQPNVDFSKEIQFKHFISHRIGWWTWKIMRDLVLKFRSCHFKIKKRCLLHWIYFRFRRFSSSLLLGWRRKHIYSLNNAKLNDIKELRNLTRSRLVFSSYLQISFRLNNEMFACGSIPLWKKKAFLEGPQRRRRLTMKTIKN